MTVISDPGGPVADWLELTPHLSSFDRALIRQLQEDGRKSFAQLAEELGVAKKTVRRRLQELEGRGVVRITTIGDPYLMGYRVIAQVGVCIDSSRPVTAIAEELAAGPRSFYVTVVTGRYNILVEVSCVDHADLLRTVERYIQSVPGVLTYEIHPYLRLYYQNPSFEASRGDKRDLTAAPPEHFDFDHIDREIIARLNQDGRLPYQTIARDLAISDSQVRQRVRRMTTAGALRIMALTIPEGLGFHTVSLIGVTTLPGANVEEVAARFAGLHAVIYVAITAGRYQLHIEVVCTDEADFLRLQDTELRGLEGVASLEPWTYLQLYYRSVRPFDPEVDGWRASGQHAEPDPSSRVRSSASIKSTSALERPPPA
jgi:Lrp/AsnC family transcriptional regulator for asnA, asnC and gidA